jgi:hypothetical protein
MKLGWRILLPASFVNIAVTGVVVLGLDGLGTPVSRALAVAADVSQAIVALVLACGAVGLVSAFRGQIRRQSEVLGSSALQVAKLGGTQHGPMQA